MRSLIIFKLLFYLVAFEYKQPVGWRIKQPSIPILKSVKISFFLSSLPLLFVFSIYISHIRKLITGCF